MGKMSDILCRMEGEVKESYPGKGTQVRGELERRFPKEYRAWMKKAKEGYEAEKKFFDGKGREYFEMANRLHAEADTLYRALKKKAGL